MLLGLIAPYGTPGAVPDPFLAGSGEKKYRRIVNEDLIAPRPVRKSGAG